MVAARVWSRAWWICGPQQFGLLKQLKWGFMSFPGTNLKYSYKKIYEVCARVVGVCLHQEAHRWKMWITRKMPWFSKTGGKWKLWNFSLLVLSWVYVTGWIAPHIDSVGRSSHEHLMKLGLIIHYLNFHLTKSHHLKQRRSEASRLASENALYIVVFWIVRHFLREPFYSILFTKGDLNGKIRGTFSFSVALHKFTLFP